MTVTMMQDGEKVTMLLNSIYVSIKGIIPIEHEVSKPSLITDSIHTKYGVMIGITGDIKGQLLIEGKNTVFGRIGEVMFGMPLEGDMLHSFNGELANMIAGRLAMTIANRGVNTDITSPTIVYGDTNLLGYQQAIKVTFTFEGVGKVAVYLLLDL